MRPLSAVIIARDEESKIGAAVASALPWVSEVLVLDGGSTDGTVGQAKAAGARVVHHPFDGFVSQKRRAVALAAHDHVVIVDSDERIGPRLGASILRVRRDWPAETGGFRVHRWNYLDGAAVRGAGWGADRPVRVFDRRTGEVAGVDPHDRVEVEGFAPVLPGVLHHDPDRSTRAYVRATVSHARRASESIARAGRPGPAAPWLHAAAHFARKVVLGGAPLQGRRGMTVAWVGAKGVARKYRLARRLPR
ncbi:MAG: glycosyltransferase family 2 protein [Deltaproteobacteria bacterium]|nr:glycosyltransferase family 2 protein [Deltaproteobacteria bacterium]